MSQKIMVKKKSQNLSNCKFEKGLEGNGKSAEQNLQGVSEKDLFVSPHSFLLFLLLLLPFGDFEFCLAFGRLYDCLELLCERIWRRISRFGGELKKTQRRQRLNEASPEIFAGDGGRCRCP